MSVRKLEFRFHPQIATLLVVPGFMLTASFAALLLAITARSIGAGVKAGNVGPPQIRLETGGHIGQVSQVLFGKDGDMLSVGLDKTLRVWKLNPLYKSQSADADPPVTIRYATDDTEEGEYSCAAINSNGDMLALGVDGGKNPWSIYFVNPKTWQIIHRINVGQSPEGAGSRRLNVAFSPDGSQLAACGYVMQGDNFRSFVSVIETSGWKKKDSDVKANDRYNSIAYNPAVGSEFAVGRSKFSSTVGPNHQQGSAAWHGSVEVYNYSSGKLQQKRTLNCTTLRQIMCLDWSVKDDVAAGDFNGHVSVWQHGSKEPILLDTKQSSAAAAVEVPTADITFNKSGEQLAAAFYGSSAAKSYGHVTIWSTDKLGTIYADIEPKADATAVKFNDGGSLAVGDVLGGLKVYSPDGKGKFPLNQTMHSVMHPASRVFWAAKGRQIGWQTDADFDKAAERESQKVWFDLDQLSEETSGQPPSPADSQTQGIACLPKPDDSSTQSVTLKDADGKTIGEIDIPASIDFDRNLILRGPEDTLLVANGTSGITQWDPRTHKPNRSFSGGPSHVQGMAVSPDGKYLAASCADLVVRIWPLDANAPQTPGTREVEPLLCLYYGKDLIGNKHQYIVWNQHTGYFYAKTDICTEMMLWQLNDKDADSPQDPYPASICQSQFKKKDAITRMIQTGDAGAPPPVSVADYLAKVPRIESVEPYNQDAKVTDGIFHTSKLEPLIVAVKLRQDFAGVTFSSDTSVTRLVQVKSIDPKASGTTPQAESLPTGTTTVQVKSGGAHRVTIFAADTDGDYFPFPIKVQYDGTGQTLGKLWVLAIGINKYGGPLFDLKYCVHDAESVSALFEAQRGNGLYSDVTVISLPEEQATQSGIPAALNELKTKTSDEDTVVLFVASHGARADQLAGDSSRDDCLLVPYGAIGPGDAAVNPSKCVSWKNDILKAVSSMHGTKVLFVDCCMAGEITDLLRVVDNTGHSSNMFALVAARSDQASNEIKGNVNGHGLFTHCLLQVLQGQFDAKAVLSLDDLRTEVPDQVRRLTEQLDMIQNAEPYTTQTDILQRAIVKINKQQ